MRAIIIPIQLQVLIDALTRPPGVRATDLPPGAVVRHVWIDNSINPPTVMAAIEHESFKPVGLGNKIPYGSITLTDACACLANLEYHAKPGVDTRAEEP